MIIGLFFIALIGVGWSFYYVISTAPKYDGNYREIKSEEGER